MEVYFYIPLNEAEYAVECGLKLSKWYDKEVLINGEIKRCISAFLNPRDDMDKLKSPGLKCLKLEIRSNYCFIADKYLYHMGLNNPEIMPMYEKSVIPVETYSFGSYRLPECLVTSTVIADQISVLGKRLDSPILIVDSEKLYVNNIIEMYKDKFDDFNDTMLYYFYCRLTEMGKMDKLDDKGLGMAVFRDKASLRTYTIKIPDMQNYF